MNAKLPHQIYCGFYEQLLICLIGYGNLNVSFFAIQLVETVCSSWYASGNQNYKCYFHLPKIVIWPCLRKHGAYSKYLSIKDWASWSISSAQCKI